MNSAHECNYDMIERIYSRDGYRCQSCGASVYKNGTPQLAHRVPQRKHVIERYGHAAIHHPLNLAAACCLECNGRLQLHASEWDEWMAHVEEAISAER